MTSPMTSSTGWSVIAIAHFFCCATNDSSKFCLQIFGAELRVRWYATVDTAVSTTSSVLKGGLFL